MKVLLVFIFGLAAAAMFTDPDRPTRPRTLQMIAVCCLLAGTLMMRRFI